MSDNTLTVDVEDLTDDALLAMLAACEQRGRDVTPGNGGHHVPKLKAIGRVVAGELWKRGYQIVPADVGRSAST